MQRFRIASADGASIALRARRRCPQARAFGSGGAEAGSNAPRRPNARCATPTGGVQSANLDSNACMPAPRTARQIGSRVDLSLPSPSGSLSVQSWNSRIRREGPAIIHPTVARRWVRGNPRVGRLGAARQRCSDSAGAAARIVMESMESPRNPSRRRDSRYVAAVP